MTTESTTEQQCNLEAEIERLHNIITRQRVLFDDLLRRDKDGRWHTCVHGDVTALVAPVLGEA